MSESDQAVRTLREWRTKVFYMSQAEFAEKLGVDTSTLSLWESGKRRPRFRNIRQIAERLEIRPDQLRFEGREQQEREG